MGITSNYSTKFMVSLLAFIAKYEISLRLSLNTMSVILCKLYKKLS